MPEIRIPFIGTQIGDENATKARVCESLYDKADMARRRYEADWMQNLMFLAGNQWAAVHSDIRRFGRKTRIAAPNTKVQVVVHRILPLYRQALATLRSTIARNVAIPATSDEDDVFSADLGTDFLDSRHYEDNEPVIRLNELGWAVSCGRATRMTLWDADKASTLAYGDGENAGDIDPITLSPWRVHMCPWDDSSTNPSWVIVSDVRDVDEINDIYKPERKVTGEEMANPWAQMDRLLTNVVLDGGGSGYSNIPKREEAAILKRMYAAPTPSAPHGKVFTWANGVFLQEEELPEGQMPFVFMDWLPIPGRLYPLPFLSPLRDLQRETNITLSQLIELKNRQLRGDIAIKGHGDVHQVYGKDVDGNPTTQKVIRVDPGVDDWRFIEYKQNPTEAEYLLNQMWNDSMEIAGIREASLGKQVGSQVTATQVLALKESDVQGLALFRMGFDESYADADRQKLLLAKNHYHLPRLIRVVGENNSVRAQAFYGSDLRNTEDVRPKPMPMLTEAEKSQVRVELAAAGAYDLSGPPNVKMNKVRALLNSGDPGVQEEVEQQLGMSVDDLAAECAELNRIEIAAAKLAAVQMLQQIAQPPQPMEGDSGMGGDPMMGGQPQVAGPPMMQ